MDAELHHGSTSQSPGCGSMLSWQCRSLVVTLHLNVAPASPCHAMGFGLPKCGLIRPLCFHLSGPTWGTGGTHQW